jgi:DNA adenine methylase
MIKSPLRYPGGKSRGVKYLKSFLPDYSEFREVFFGGGSLTFYCIQQHPERVYSASDLNYELYCFWSQLKCNSEKLIDGVQVIFDRYKKVQNDGGNFSIKGKELFCLLVSRRESNLSELERAIDFFILNRITFSGVVDSGGYSQGSFDGRFTQSAIDRLKTTAPVIQPIDFLCEDYNYLLNKEGEDVFIFLDPPYYSATKSKLYGKKGILHTQFDHQLMFKELKTSRHKWLITYDNSEYIKDLYKDFYQVEWQLQYGMTNSNNSPSVLGNELLIANYDLLDVQKRMTNSHE